VESFESPEVAQSGVLSFQSNRFSSEWRDRFRIPSRNAAIRVSNLIGSPASGEIKKLKDKDFEDIYGFQSNRFSSEWRVDTGISMELLFNLVSNLIGSPASGERTAPPVLDTQFRMAPKVSNLIGSPASGENLLICNLRKGS